MFVINSLVGGGAERVLAIIAREFQSRNSEIEVHLVTLDDVPDTYDIPEDIVRHRLNTDGSLLRSYFSLRGLVAAQRPDVVVAFLTRANLAAALIGWQRGIRTVISERVNTTSHFANRSGRFVFRPLVRWLYPLAEKIICVSEGVRKDLASNFGIPPRQLCVVHNPADLRAIAIAARAAPDIELPQEYFVAVGRLVPNKNVANLLHALQQSRTNTALVVLGEGPEKDQLRSLAEELGLGGRVLFAGHVSNPYAVMSRARAYVSASLAEGFPNALIEAMVLGRPVISTDCESGPAEILAEDAGLKVTGCRVVAHGILVPVGDATAMAEAMALLGDDSACEDFGERAKRRSRDFGLDAAVESYSEIILSHWRVLDAQKQFVQ